MTQPPKSLQIIGILLIILGVIGAIFRLRNAAHASNLRPQSTSLIILHAHQVAEQAAVYGRVVTAKSNGESLASYRCTQNDAAVAVVQVEADTSTKDGSLGFPPTVMVGQAVDEAGDTYPVGVEPPAAGGKIYFVTLKKGFGHVPHKVTAHLTNQMGQDIDGGEVVFTRITSPKRLISPPIGAARVAAEKIAIAEVKPGYGGPAIKIIQPHSKDEYYLAENLETSFSEQGYLAGRALADADAVKIRIHHMRTVNHDITLTYRGAEIVNTKGYRILVLPTKQSIGKIDGADTSVDRFAADNLDHIHTTSSHGTITVHVAQMDQSPRMRIPGSIRCTGVEPSLDDLGLEWLSVHVDADAVNLMLHATAHASKRSIDHVPSLRLRFHVLSQKELSVNTLVLPIHHVDNDPQLFPKTINHVGGGIGMGSPVPTRTSPVTHVGSAL